jgi:tetratricopeptide (TPR) repeat protein
MSAFLCRFAFWAAAVGLVGLNAWRAWDDRPAVPLRTVQEWTSHGRAGEAEAELRRQVRKSPHDDAALMQLARVYAARDDYAACARALRAVPFWAPQRAEALFLEGQAWKLLDRARDAEAAWEALVVDDPLHPVDPRYFSGAARELIAHYVVKGRLDEARRVLWQAYQASDPREPPDVLLMRLRAELERVAHEEAVAVLRRYAAADPSDWGARRALAVEEQHAGRPEEADRHADACLKARSDDPWAWRARLEVFHLRGDRAALKAALGRAPKSADTDPEVWKYRGLVRTWDGDLPGAASAFEKAAALDPREPEYVYLLGMAEQRLGRRAEAAAHLLRGRRLRADFEQMHDAYGDYRAFLVRSPDGGAEARPLVERIASLCDRLGWTREADAWRKALTGG